MPSPPVVDLRSDTVTAPTAGMRAAMAAAEVGDDVYGEDPTVRGLEEQVAGMLGHEAGLFVVTGSLGNQLGLRLGCPPGGELLCDDGAHVLTYELGAAAMLAGVTTRTFLAPGGVPDPSALAAQARPDGFGTVPTRAVALEQTHNRAGGTVIPLPVLAEIGGWARRQGVHLHLDGARLWNAAVATGLPPRAFAELAGTVSVCLSKGLGAPVGSVLVGPAPAIAEARVWRKRLGAGWRQAGLLAAAGRYALEHHLDRLAEDHRRAARLAAGLGLPAPATNIVPIPVPDTAAALAACEPAGVRLGALAPGMLRAVTHLDVDDRGIDRAVQVLGPLMAA